jgi:hypothetical protein
VIKKKKNNHFEKVDKNLENKVKIMNEGEIFFTHTQKGTYTIHCSLTLWTSKSGPKIVFIVGGE